MARILRAFVGMKAVVLSAVPKGGGPVRSALALLECELARAGYDEVVHFEVGLLKLGYCQGEFDCWLRSPGRCKIHDDEQAILAAIPGADALFLVSPIAFGGFGSALKRAIDRLIGLVTPFFERRSALTHHEARYARYPRLYSVGVLPTRDDGQSATFIALNDANAVNFSAPSRGAAVLDEHHTETWQELLREMLEHPFEPGASVPNRQTLRRELIEVARPDALTDPRPLRTAALLVGSAKAKGTSASEHLARAFARVFEAAGVACRIHFATEFVHTGVTALGAARSLATADLFFLASPLYVDSLPSLTTHALELVDHVRAGESRSGVFVPLVNCGFPEPEQTRTALRIARHFARAAGYGFAGALPLGGGGVVTPDRSLEEPKPPLSHVVRAIALAAPALVAGGGVPAEALDCILAAPLPESIYRMMGEFGFRREAHRLGTSQRDLRAAPFGSPR
jgi:multimeric flavodoxin WrbA